MTENVGMLKVDTPEYMSEKLIILLIGISNLPVLSKTYFELKFTRL